MKYKLYTDGATSNNGYDGARGGWAWALIQDNRLIQSNSNGQNNVTNNYCELQALIEGCAYVREQLSIIDTVEVFSDSAYCINCYKQHWYINWEKNGWQTAAKQPVKNKEQWMQLIPFFNDPRFTFNKVKGHNGNEWNEFVDNLAVAAKEI